MKLKFNIYKFISLIVVLLSTPLLVFADPVFTDFKTFVYFIISAILTPLVSLIVGFTVVYFLWGTSKYILHGGDVVKREEGRKSMFYGIIAIFVMVSVWGLVNMLVGTFGFDVSPI